MGIATPRGRNTASRLRLERRSVTWNGTPFIMDPGYGSAGVARVLSEDDAAAKLPPLRGTRHEFGELVVAEEGFEPPTHGL